MAYRYADLELANRHIADAEARIARQQETIAEHEARGWPTADACMLLRHFKDTLEQMTIHRDLIAANLTDEDHAEVWPGGKPAGT